MANADFSALNTDERVRSRGSGPKIFKRRTSAGTLRAKCPNEQTNFDDVIGFRVIISLLVRYVRPHALEIPLAGVKKFLSTRN